MQLFYKVQAFFSSYPLHDAARRGNLKLLASLLTKSNQGINDYYETLAPIHFACTNHHYDCMLLLLKAKADVSITSKFIKEWTALHTAASKQDRSAIRLLILHGADLMFRDKAGKTPVELTPENSMARRVIEKTTQIYERLTTYTKQQQAEQAACWQQAAEEEENAFLKAFYYFKALNCAYGAYENQGSEVDERLMKQLCLQIAQIPLEAKEKDKLAIFFDKNILEIPFANNSALQQPFKYSYS